MNLKKIIVLLAVGTAGYVTIKEIIKRRNKDKMIGYIPIRLSGKIREILEKEEIIVKWSKIGGANSLFGLRLRLYNINNTEIIKTIKDIGVMVVGVSFDNRQITIAEMNENNIIYLVHNPHEKDPNCVEVWRKK